MAPLPSADKLPAAEADADADAADTKASGSAGTGTAPAHDEPTEAECFGLAAEVAAEDAAALASAPVGNVASAGMAAETVSAPEAEVEDDGDASAAPLVEFCCCATRKRPAE